jgi:hypothetical protein
MTMRQVLLPMLAVITVTCFWTPIAYAQGQLWCVPHRACLTVTDQSFNACDALASQRGWTRMLVDRVGRNAFIYQCLTGKVR